MAYVPFSKTLELMRLADMAAARPQGICLDDIKITFNVNHRSAQRMAQALELVFPAVSKTIDPTDRRKWWSLSGSERQLRWQGIQADELSALEMGIRRAKREGAITEVRALEALRHRLIALHPASEVRRAETDAEATLEARGHACRPGPRTSYDPAILDEIDTALKGPFKLDITYIGEHDPEPRSRTVEPYGVLFGLRCYLVCFTPEEDTRVRHFRLDRILKARRLKESFVRDEGFDLAAHAARSFGAFNSKTEFGKVVWRFNQRAAPVAREYVFHPNQVIEEEPDGALIVSFEASGWLEMAWHLYGWGDTVEVLAPDELRMFVANYRRHDFPSFP